MAIYCTCHKDVTGVWYDSPDETNELQVHPKCRKPHRVYFESVSGMLAPKSAQALIHEFGRTDGINELTYVVGDNERVMVEVLSTQPDAVVHMWNKLDECIDILKDGEPALHPPVKIMARTVATCISFCMPKHYPNADAVAVEALLRYESGDSEGNVTRRTPGLADDELKKPEAPKPTHSLDEAKIVFIKSAKDTIPVNELARMFSVSEAVIRSLL